MANDIDLPIYNTPFTDARGNISEVWWRFFVTLLERTGGTEGIDIDALLQLIKELFERLQEASIATGNSDSKAVQAIDAITRLSRDVELLASAPSPDLSRIDVLASAVRGLDELSGTLDAKASQALNAVVDLARLLETDAGSAMARANQISDSLQNLMRLLETGDDSALAKANQVADSLQALSRTLEIDTGTAAANRVNDLLHTLARSIEVTTTNQAAPFPRTFSIDYLDWNQTPAYVAQTARMAWNASDDTLNLHHSDGVTQQMGQELYGRILNNTGSTIPNGTCLGINPATNSYVQFIANGTLSPITIVGVTTQAIPNATSGRITVWGRVRDIDTTGTPYGEVWAAGQILYVSPTVAGGFTNVKPTAPNLSLPIAQVAVVSSTVGQIAVRPTVEQQLFYGQFAKTADQVPTAINTANAITWSSSLIANGITIGAPTSRIVVANAGLYRFSASFQITSGSASVKNVYLWYRKNGVDIPNSTLITSMDSGTAIRAPSRSLLVSLAANDYVEMMWAADDVNVTLDAIPATAFSPAAPAALLTVQQEQQ